MYTRKFLLALVAAIHCEAFVVRQSMSRHAVALREAEEEGEEPKMNPNRPNLPEVKGDFDWDDKFGGDPDWITENIPGKIVLTELELAEQTKALAALEAKWRKEREIREYEESKKTGFVPLAELANGRFAMFFLATGLLTELWTGVTIPGQVEEMLRIGGFIGFD